MLSSFYIVTSILYILYANIYKKWKLNFNNIFPYILVGTSLTIYPNMLLNKIKFHNLRSIASSTFKPYYRMSTEVSQKLVDLRNLMSQHSIDAYVVTHNNSHLVKNPLFSKTSRVNISQTVKKDSDLSLVSPDLADLLLSLTTMPLCGLTLVTTFK